MAALSSFSLFATRRGCDPTNQSIRRPYRREGKPKGVSPMTRSFAIVWLLLSAGIAPAAESAVKIGAPIDDLRFKDIRYLSRSLKDFGDKKAFVLVFVDANCPLAAKYLPLLQRLENAYRDKGVQFVAVNAGPNDTIVAMAAQAVEHGVEFPFVKDADCRVADALGVQRTPEVVVLDAKRVLRYRGRIDDQYRPGGQRSEPTRRDLQEALDAVLAGKEVTVPTTTVDGCLITRPATNQKDKLVTFADHIAPILEKHCQRCHRPNTAAPFALQTYEQVKAKGRTIGEVVNEGRMPPWFAAAHDGDLIQHQALSAAERETIVQWVKTGMTRGDEARLPKPPPSLLPLSPEGRGVPVVPLAPQGRRVGVRGAKWLIGEPDLVLNAAPFELPKDGDIPYQYVIFPHVFAQETWVQGVQILPDVPRAVHHANLVYFKLGESFKESNFITGVVPGNGPLSLEDGIAFRIPKGSVLALQIHYVTSGKAQQVKLSVGLKYASGKIDQRLRHLLFVDTKFSIPPGAAAYPVKVERTLETDAIGVGLFTHMHLRGKGMTFTAHLPDGKSESLLTIPNYNFEWQIPYRWEPGRKRLPKGTRLECVALYDNSPFNPYNPDPLKTVKEGPQTYHEMMNGFLFYLDANEKLNLDIDGKTGHAREK
jgi:peroxiredoxin